MKSFGNLSDAQLVQRLRNATVFARIMPEQKLRIVNALKANGEIVAMTGDGVNDAPSLKAAHIGIAMGGRGTDVAREASSIVLLDDDFGSIVESVRLGRRIYDNLRKAMAFILAVHVPIAGLALLPLLFGLPILFGPVAYRVPATHDRSGVFAGLRGGDGGRRRDAPIAPGARRTAVFRVIDRLGTLCRAHLHFALVAAIFVMGHMRGMPEDEVRALTFFALVLSIISLIFVNRSFSASLASAVLRPNTTLLAVLLVVVAMLGLTLLWPLASGVFRFGPLHWNDLAVTLGVGAVVLVSLEALKPLWRKRLLFPGAPADVEVRARASAKVSPRLFAPATDGVLRGARVSPAGVQPRTVGANC